jgi:hypothetical protein
MNALYLINAGVYLIIGTTLLLVWQRHRAQTFARDMGCSTLFAGLLPVGYLVHLVLPAPWRELGLPLVVLGAIPNLLFLTSGVLQLSGRRLSRVGAAVIAVLALLVLLVPATGDKLRYWASFNMTVLVTLGALVTLWTWRTGAGVRLAGLLLIALGVDQLPLVLYG